MKPLTLQRLFSYRFAHPIYPTLCFLLLGTVLTGLALLLNPRSLGSSLVFLAIGMSSWSLVEYILHRFVFHLTEVREPYRSLASGLHMAHHENTTAKDLVVAPPMVSFGFGSILLLLFWALTQSFSAAALMLSGLFIGYILYEWVHYGAHQYNWNFFPGRFWKKYHLQHHFKHPDVGFGVTSPFWDWVFHTYPKQKTTWNL